MKQMTDNSWQNDFGFPVASNDWQQAIDLPVIWVDNKTQLNQLLDELADCELVALDTEFIKRDTYYPILALVQINTGRAIYLLDAPKLDLGDFWQVLSRVPTMIWYACGEDLGIYYLLSKCPPLTNVFDVQIGIAYLTGVLQAGYSQAIFEVLGVALDKGESKSNWLARPLSEEQLQYAINDVRYLPALYHSVKAALSERGILDYVIEDSQHYANELHATQHLPDDQLYLDLIAPTYHRRQIALLQDLVIWREELARAMNLPRTFIINRQALREIITDQPTSIKALAGTTINRGTLRRHGDEIVKIVKQTLQQSENTLPPLPPPTYHSREKPFKNELNDAVQSFATKMGVPSNLLLKNRWINEMLLAVAYDWQFDQLPPDLQGYRREWIELQILPMLSKYKEHILQVLTMANEQVS